MRSIVVILFIVSIFNLAGAQEELGTHLLRETWSANRSNPALLPPYKWVIGLPAVYDNLLITNVTYADLVVDQNGEQVLDVDNAILKLKADNQIRENLDIETLSFAYRFGQFTLSAGHALHFGAWLNYPKTLPQLIWQGNAQFIGQTVDFGPDIQLMGYHEFYVGGALTPVKGLTIGARAKYLSGIAEVSTERRKLELTTDEEAYALTLDADFLANSAGTVEYNGFDDLTLRFDFGKFDTKKFFSKNSGYAFDFGARLELGKWDFAASILDLGKIEWKEDVKNYSLQGIYEFKGLDIAQNLLEDSSDIGSVLDTLRQTYEPTETSIAYTTELPTRIYLSAAYNLTDAWRLGGLFYTETYRNKSFPAFAVSANFKVLPILRVGALYAFRNSTYDNFGANATLQLGPVQILAATDNLLTAFRLKDSNSANVRVGLSLLLGKIEN